MKISTLKRKKDVSLIEPNKKCTTNNKSLGFHELCQEITRKQINVLAFGKLFGRNLIIIKLN